MAKCKGKLPPGYGTEEHMATVWEECKRDKVLHHLGEDYSPNRWKNWSDRFAYYHDSFDLLLMVICYILVTRGSIKDLDSDLPALKGLLRGLQAVGGLDLPADALEIDLKSLKENSKMLEARKHKGSSSMLIIAESLSNTTSRKLGIFLWKFPESFEKNA